MVSILGVPVTPSRSLEEAVDFLSILLLRQKQIFITTPNPEHVVQAQHDAEFLGILQEADLAVPDGVGLVWAAKKLYPEVSMVRIAGVDFAVQVCKWAQGKGYKVGLLGGRFDVGEQATNRLKALVNDLDVVWVGAHEDIRNVSERSDKEVLSKIKAEGVEVLLVAYGAPFQEKWIVENMQRLGDVKVFMPVGGSFDFWAGKVRRAPLWMRKLGLEWLFRLILQPWRIFRQFRLVEFLWLVLRARQKLNKS
jgi:N-acetylglucosaminyldiphosphoundecaprenol N-acetyl-beta-D-mannosaminyltransferase